MTSASRPRRRLGEDERRAQITAAALQEVVERGYEGASLTRVAARAGVAKGLVWHYFAGKDDLMGAAARAAMEAMRADVVDAVDLDRPVPDVIRSAVRAAASLVRSRRDELVAVHRIVHNLRRAGGDTVTTDFYEEIHRGQEELFRRGQAEGSLRDGDPGVMAVTYQGAIDTMLAHLEAHPDVDPGAYAAELAEILLGGLQGGT